MTTRTRCIAGSSLTMLQCIVGHIGYKLLSSNGNESDTEKIDNVNGVAPASKSEKYFLTFVDQTFRIRMNSDNVT